MLTDVQTPFLGTPVVPLKIPVSVKNTPPEKKTRGKNSFQSTKSGGGCQFLQLDCRARARTKGVFVSQTPV